MPRGTQGRGGQAELVNAQGGFLRDHENDSEVMVPLTEDVPNAAFNVINSVVCELPLYI